MKLRLTRWWAPVASLVVIVLAAGITAYAEMPAASPPVLDGVDHQWVRDEMGYAPYTEPAVTEKSAKRAATAALVAPPAGVLRGAEHGYAEASATLKLAESLRKASPRVVGHELLVWNGDKAARLLVGNSGGVKLLEVGPIQEMLVTHAASASDAGDKDAIEIAKRTFDVAAGLDPATTRAANALVSAHEIGFADQDGSHLVVRVGLDGSTAYPDW